MGKLVSVTMVALALVATPALAGNASMKNADGVKLRINCTGGGCKVRQKAPGAKWSTVEQTQGGTENFNALQAKYKSQGFN